MREHLPLYPFRTLAKVAIGRDKLLLEIGVAIKPASG